MKYVIMIIATICVAVGAAAQGTIVAEYPEPATTAVTSNWSYGFYGGIGYQFPTSSLKDNFGSCVTFQVGATVGYRRLRFKADIAYGQPSLKNSNMFNVPDSAGFQMQGNSNASATHLMSGFQLGYVAWQTDRVAITPSAGLHYNGYLWDVENYSWTKDDNDIYTRHITTVERRSLHSWNWMASVDIDFKLHSHLTGQPLMGGNNHESFTSWVRVTPWVSRSVFNKCDPAVKGYNFGITVCYLGLGRITSY